MYKEINMVNVKNKTELQKLEDKLEGSSAVFLADYSGLSVKDQVALRDRVREAGGELRITKNRLLKLALKNKAIDTDSFASDLLGPNITLFAGKDPISPLKALVEFAKGNEAEKPAIKAGVMDKEILTLEKVKQLASLPGKNELIAKLLGTLTNPARNMVNVLIAPTRNLVYALSAIKDKKAVN